MGTVRFLFKDACILWCVHGDGCDLESLIHVYTFVDRAAVPSYEEMNGCLSRAVRAGIMLFPTGGRYRLTPKWSAQMGEYPADVYGMVDFAEWLITQDLPDIGADFTLDQGEYRGAARAVQGSRWR